ncbi:MAG TPA: tRNA preQ1(34) S-adenosylmethionine ribosyltransferase-isomerase QueA [Spirochaetota bacterium]|nr:tRNA preQ1(34) S-adenosylmethionine ribosyltransferase-isomerase QueA [Spirochaetota bacterium]HPI89980.1 tRNA preQ1(34) S-adenosylmethionine ribosyltransferase-isomerase QueA [Spirochaetota bacterium]HPR48415.1 tRNA preQ1(34) S-adenosylmethionine ribosyltransferase-isomerase QueA [Spirochaetota bacterium]
MNNGGFTLDDFDFTLPDELIAQYPVERRDDSRLFILNRKSGSFTHKKFNNITDFIHENDVIVLNDARVLAARIFCLRSGGGKVELILTSKQSDKQWQVISNRTRRLKNGEILHALKNPEITLTITGRSENLLNVETSVPLTEEILYTIGEMPLPPYIKRSGNEDDFYRYQTVYAAKPGAAAAPTAGLHFTEEILDQIAKKHARIGHCTLYVSWGTFQPVRTKDISAHTMHNEHYFLPESTAEMVNNAREQGHRIIAVGTTVLRVLESTFVNGKNIPGPGETNIFIYPPHEVNSVDALITNFHTPKSTLLMLVAAFAGYETIMHAYETAVEMKYRFFSYGDAMFIM